MYVVIFRARTRDLDPEYFTVAARMRELAVSQFGCLEFQAVTEGHDEVALSYWPDEQSIRAWKAHAEHVLAQQLGRQRWYESYVVQVAQVTREYHHPAPQRDLPPGPSGTAISARSATFDDVAALATLFDQYRQFYDQPADLALAASFIRARLERADSQLFVAPDADGIILGFCQIYPTHCSVAAAPIGVLYDLFVQPRARRSGVARALLRAAQQHATAMGLARLDLSTARDNRPAQRLYESLGWRRDEIFHTYSLALAGA